MSVFFTLGEGTSEARDPAQGHLWLHTEMHSLLCPELGVLEALSGPSTLIRKCCPVLELAHAHCEDVHQEASTKEEGNSFSEFSHSGPVT